MCTSRTSCCVVSASSCDGMSSSTRSLDCSKVTRTKWLINHGVGKVTCENGEGEEVMVFDPLVENPDEASAPVIANPTEPLSGNHLIKRREDMIDVFTS